MKILIIDDDQATTMVLKAFIESLTKEPIIFIEACDLPVGLEMVGREKPNAVLLDLGLPGSQGPEHTITTFKEVIAKTPTVIVSGLADSHVSLKAIEYGAVGCVLKADVEAMTTTFKELLARASKGGGCG